MASVLVIDDDPAVRATIKLVLERNGHEVAIAGDGHAGIKALENGRFRLLIVDIFMPGMDGLETIREVRTCHPELPVIVMSGTSMQFHGTTTRAPDFLAMAVKLGAVRSLQKPFRPRDMIAVVNECLGGEAAPTGNIAE